MKSSKNYYDNWFSKRGLRDLQYQKDALHKLEELLPTSKLPVVLAQCPSAGKTIMSICFADKFISENPKARVLVLTHGTTVLRSQYAGEIEKMKPDFTFSMIEAGTDINKNDSQVIITLPQTIYNSFNLPNFDLIIIDEAHHYYLAEDGMIQGIIAQTKPKYQILLTGTPSKFILKKYPIIPVTVNKLLEHDMVEDVIVELASSTYDFKHTDYNQDYELMRKIKIRQRDTFSTMDALLKDILKRLKSIYKNNPEKYARVIHFYGWHDALKSSLHKTMIACNNQEQARQVHAYFSKKKINTALSTSDDDTDSKEIERFKQEDDCLVLIVVARGVLGFNYPELETVIDMTVSQNIDRIFQLMCRVIRKHPNGRKKLFIKLAPHYLEQYFEFVMTCVMCMTDEKYYLKYNGQNFLDLEIPITRIKKDKDENNELKEETKASESTDSKKEKKWRDIKTIDFMGLPSIRLFKDIIHKNHDAFSSYAYCKIQDIRSLVLLDIKHKYWTKERCIEDAKKYKSRHEWSKASTAYIVAWKNGWLDECCKHMIKIMGRWTKEECIKVAKKCKTRNEFKHKYETAYKKAREENFIEECCNHMKLHYTPSSYWTKSKCKKSAKKYESRFEWQLKENSAYKKALDNNWLDECCKHMIKLEKPAGYWTKEKCINSAKKCKTNKEWKNKYSGAYHQAIKNGWLDECRKHMKVKRPTGYWTKERCILVAKRCKTRGELARKHSTASQVIAKNKWQNDCYKHMRELQKPIRYWTKDRCIQVARKCKSKKEFVEKYPTAQTNARKNNFLFECHRHMKEIRKPNGYWKKDRCIEVARKCKSRKQFHKKYPTAKENARKNNFLSECYTHMKK